MYKLPLSVLVRKIGRNPHMGIRSVAQPGSALCLVDKGS